MVNPPTGGSKKDEIRFVRWQRRRNGCSLNSLTSKTTSTAPCVHKYQEFGNVVLAIWQSQMREKSGRARGKNYMTELGEMRREEKGKKSETRDVLTLLAACW